MSKFNVGDKVRVSDNARCCTTYSRWAAKYGLSQYNPAYNEPPANNSAGVVVCHGPHGAYVEYMYGVRTDDGHEHIISEEGLELETSYLQSLLTNGRRVKLRNGFKYTVLDGALISLNVSSVKIYSHSNDFANSYDEKLLHSLGSCTSANCDILEVYEKPHTGIDYFNYDHETSLIWKREEKTAKQLQLEELHKKAQEIADAIKVLQDEE